MVPPTAPLNLDVEAISGICGSISIACWVVVFSPQIIENFRRGSADGLSLQFIIVWLAGDVFNILGAVLQGVLPTMIILAVYYTIADIVLLGQCFYYRGFTWRDDVVPPKPKTKKIKSIAAVSGGSSYAGGATERTALLSKNNSSSNLVVVPADDELGGHHHHHHHHHHHERRGSNWSALSPAVPFVPDLGHLDSVVTAVPAASTTASPSSSTQRAVPSSTLQTVAFNALAMLMVCASGIAGWYLSGGSDRQDSSGPSRGDGDGSGGDSLALNFWGQVFGYLCAVLYLGSRLPQLLLNWRRQSTDGVSMLFFLFACLGNLTYVLSIFAYDGCSGQGDGCTPDDARTQYGRYLLVNLSWLAGSLGTLLLDMGIFVQFFLYQVEGDDDCSSVDEEEGSFATEVDVVDAEINNTDDDSDEDERGDRPLLSRNMSSYH